MKLIPVEKKGYKPAAIHLYTDNGNKFASVESTKQLRIYGEDSTISVEEAKVMLDISDNFDLFFKNIKTQ